MKMLPFVVVFDHGDVEQFLAFIAEARRADRYQDAFAADSESARRPRPTVD
jgi:hypothetical protein